MLHFHLKLPAGGAAALLALILLLASSSAARGASVPRYHSRYAEGRPPPAAYPPPSSDMMKALEYIENLKQKNGAIKEQPVDYDEVDKIRVLLQLASATDRQSQPPPPPPPPAPAAAVQQRQDLPAEQLVKVLLKSLQDQQAGRDTKPASAAPGSDRRVQHRHRTEESGGPAAQSAPPGGDYGNFPRPHKKYPLMFEDEENRDAFKRATEDLDEQYTPQSLANLRSIFDELGRMPTATANGQKRGGFFGDDEDEEDAFGLRSLAYEDVAGGEDWVPVEERMETEELVNGSHDEYDRDLNLMDEGSDPEAAEREEMQRRAAGQDDEEADDDTKLVDYYLLKVLEMSDQTQKRGDQGGEQRKRLIRPSLVDPRTIKELLELSLRLHVPPQDLIDLLLTDELRKLHRHHPQTATSTHFRTGQTPRIRYYSRRLPVKSKVAPEPEDMDREDFLDIIGVETISNEYPVRQQRPLKTPAASPARAPVPPPAPAAKPVIIPAKIPSSSGRRENLFLSELNKMPLKRQADDDDDDDDVEDEVTTYLAAKILTEYPPQSISKRDTQQAHQFPYELYEQAMKDFLDQADTGSNKGRVAKRETESDQPPEEEEAIELEPTANNDVALKTAAPQTADEEENEHRGVKQIAGM